LQGLLESGYEQPDADRPKDKILPDQWPAYLRRPDNRLCYDAGQRQYQHGSHDIDEVEIDFFLFHTVEGYLVN
jgi:hypothetical protein